jgi:hypothetical protein
MLYFCFPLSNFVKEVSYILPLPKFWKLEDKVHPKWLKKEITPCVIVP